MMHSTMGRNEWLLLGLLSVLFGSVFLFVKVALADVRPFAIVLGRVSFAAVVLIILVYVTGQRLPTDLRLWGAFCIMGALNSLIPFSLIFWGQTQITTGLAAILNATTPLFTIVLAHFLVSDEKLTSNRLSGVILGLVGVTVVIGPEALEGLGRHVMAQLAVLGGALSYACAGLFGRRFKEHPPLIPATGQMTTTTLMMLPIVCLVDQPWTLPVPRLITCGALLGLAVFSTAAAFVIYFRLLATAGATNLLLVTFLFPVSAIVLGALVLGEQLELKHFAGMALIALGLAAIDGRLLARIHRRVGAVMWRPQ